MYKPSSPHVLVLILACALLCVALVGCRHSQQETTATSNQVAVAGEGGEAPQKAALMKSMPRDFKKR
jgi:hypothetical protein